MPSRSRIARGINCFVRDPAARSTDERCAISAQFRERGQETTKIDEEKRQGTAESPEESGQGAKKVAAGGTKVRRQG